jgi:hypothetical protein
MKKTKIIYRITTGLFAAFMLLSSIPDILILPDAVTFIVHLGYPVYFVPFIGIAKLLGCVAIVVPGYPRLREWAYAGLFFDLAGASYSVMAVGDGVAATIPILVVIVVGALSYIYYHRQKEANATVSESVPG